MLNFAPEIKGAAHETVKVGSRVPFRQPGTADDEVLLVLSGLLGLYITDERGLRQFVGLRFPGEALLPGERGRCGLWPLVESELAVAKREELEPVTVAGFDLWQAALRRSLAIAHEWLAQSRAGKTERLAHVLCEIAVRGGYGTEKIPNTITQTQLADITGQTSVNVNRALAELKGLGLISRPLREIAFADWEGLCAFADFNPRYLDAA